MLKNIKIMPYTTKKDEDTPRLFLFLAYNL